MKTVWHWNNILKTAAVVLLVAAWNMFLAVSIEFENSDLAATFALFIGVVSGYAAVTVCMAKWELFHFE